MAAATRILIVDDHPLVREGLIGLLSAEPAFEVCGEAAGLAEARQIIKDKRPHVVIVDLTLRDGNGMELVKELRGGPRDIKVLVLSMHDEALFAERALRAGAAGYVSKHEAARTIIQAVHTVLSGKLCVSQRLTEQMVNRAFSGKVDIRHSPIEYLSDRELQVFELIGQGLTVRQIATRLELSPKTVETHREHIKDKLELKNTTELTRHAVQWVLER